MLIYVTLYLIIVSLGLANSYSIPKLNYKRLVAAVSLLMIAVAGLRCNIGYDWNFYQKLFTEASLHSIFNSLEAEPLFQVLMLSIKVLHLPFQTLILLVAIISISLKTLFITKYSPIPLLSIVVLLSFFLSGELGQIRQSLAVGIVLWSFVFVLKDKFYLFALVVIVASLFHYSAAIFILVYPISKINFSIKTIGIILVVAIILNFTSWFGIFPWVINYMPDYIQHKFEAYYTVGNIALTKQTFYYRLGLFILCWYLLSPHKNPVYNLTMKIYLLGIILFVSCAPIDTLAGRGTIYFKEFEILLIPFLINEINDKKRLKLILLTLFIGYHSRHFWANLILNKDIFVPYQTFF